MLKAFSTRRNRNRSLILLMVCYALAIAAAIRGIGGNSPGLFLAFLSASYFVLAFVHPWRTSKQFLRLVYVSGGGFVLLTVFHLVSAEIKSNMLESPPANGFFMVLRIFVDPVVNTGADLDHVTILFLPVLLVGALGAVVMFGWERRHRRAPPR